MFYMPIICIKYKYHLKIEVFYVFLRSFVLFGFDEIVLRDLGQKNISDDVILGSSIILRLLFAVITYIAGAILFIFFLVAFAFYLGYLTRSRVNIK